MIYPATQTIHDALVEHNLRCGIEERENTSLVRLGINAKETTFEIMFISASDRNDVAMRILNFLKFPKAQTDTVIMAASACNVAYRFLKFCVDTENCIVTMEYDFTDQETNIGEIAHEMVIRSAGIVDECYPKIMSCIYPA